MQKLFGQCPNAQVNKLMRASHRTTSWFKDLCENILWSLAEKSIMSIIIFLLRCTFQNIPREGLMMRGPIPGNFIPRQFVAKKFIESGERCIAHNCGFCLSRILLYFHIRVCVRPCVTGVTSHLFTFITGITPCKPYIFWKLMTAYDSLWQPLSTDDLVTTWWPLGSQVAVWIRTVYSI